MIRFLLLVILSSFAQIVFAAGERINWQTLDLGGFVRTGGNYRVFDSCVWGAVEKSASANYGLQSGYINRSLGLGLYF